MLQLRLKRMHVKFRITFEDGTTMESHDEMYNEVRDHAHALMPHNNKRWVFYELITDTGKRVGVSFKDGCFFVNGICVQPGHPKWGVLTFDPDLQNFENVHENWKFLNGLPYYPIAGRKVFKGEWGESKLFYCGWKKKWGDEVLQHLIYIYPNGDGEIVFE